MRKKNKIFEIFFNQIHEMSNKKFIKIFFILIEKIDFFFNS